MVASATEGPIVAVVGATGAQGGSVIDHLTCSDKPYRLIALTRDTNKPKSKELGKKGCKVVEADITKKEDLDKAFKGAEIVFAVTDFWQHLSKDQEINDGKCIVDAAKDAATVKLFIWSGLEPVKQVTQGKFSNVDHFDSKATVADYARSAGLTISNVQAGCYMSNFANQLGGPRRQENGDIVFALPMSPDGKISLLDTGSDYGAFVRAAIEEMKPGTEMLACAEEKSIGEMVKEWSEVTGVKATFQQIKPEDFITAKPGKLGVELLEMWHPIEEYGYFGGQDIKPSQDALQVNVHFWKDFVKATKWEVLA